jgi:hypothetical protein
MGNIWLSERSWEVTGVHRMTQISVGVNQKDEQSRCNLRSSSVTKLCMNFLSVASCTMPVGCSVANVQYMTHLTYL